ncbi:rubrerythrin-like domain-containing protein [Halorientalis pallida]|uniref:Rubrerythrin-like domain-containing protein n=1 Tax=Halorientalis pallida TaxID=2479928 RepID=A0A498KRW0_9EURY|nr:rubrerythrin-like domain-containing protein [Halorientalis pallida]RXK46435.1 rubrerythrin-like domain-containing protein [Halorientalis pallida]
MPLTEPVPDTDPYYECLDCDQRITEEVDDRLCPDCGGYLEDLTVPR